MVRYTLHPLAAVTAIAALSTLTHAGSSPWASQVISYEPGSNNPGLDNPAVALGEPTRFTGEPVFPAVVSAFNPPWTAADLVSIGGGGHLTVRFDSPIIDHPGNPFGIDLIIFGNTGFIDANWPAGIVGGVFGDDGGAVEVSADGETWHLVPGAPADAMFPTIGYLDAGPYDETPGRVPSDFTRPVDPGLTLADFSGLSHEDVVALYQGSGGGNGIDIATTGLSEVHYVRISNPAGGSESVEIDGFARITPPVTGDLNRDGLVDVLDLLLLLGNWGPVMPDAAAADLNSDEVVDIFDLLILLANWSS